MNKLMFWVVLVWMVTLLGLTVYALWHTCREENREFENKAAAESAPAEDPKPSRTP